MLRATRFTLRLHRFEIVVAVALLALVAVSAVIVWGHVQAADPGPECWSRHWSYDGTATRACERRIAAFWAVRDEVGLLTGMSLALPFAVGILLGVPVVGRELEVRTAALAWSLSGDRRRWLLTRFLPMAVIVAIGIPLVAWLLAEMARAAYPWNYRGPGRIPYLADLGTEGVSLIGRGVLALGLGLLSGAVVGRTLPAVAVAAVASLAFVGVGGPLIQDTVARSVAVWVEARMDPDRGDDTGPSLRTFDREYISPGGRGFTSYEEDTRGGLPDQFEILAIECPECLGESEESYRASDAWWSGVTVRERVAPASSYPSFDRTEALVTSALGLLCILVTFPVVARRRPA